MHEMRKTDTRSAIGKPSLFEAMSVMGEPAIGTPRNGKARCLPFHANCEPVVPGFPRAGVDITREGWRIYLRVRTTDEEPDCAMFEAAAKATGTTVVVPQRRNNGEVVVGLQSVAASGEMFYEISVSGCDRKKLQGAMKAVDAIGFEVVVAKEIDQNVMSSDITEFVRQLTDRPNGRKARSEHELYRGAYDPEFSVPGPEGAR